VDPGRDGCRVPLPWSGTRSPFGFSSGHAAADPWLPQPASWAEHTVEAELRDPRSMLSLYRDALDLRRAGIGLGDGPFEWIDAAPTTLAFRRGADFISITNFAAQPLALPEGAELILGSEELVDGKLPSDSTAWLRPQLEPTENPNTKRKARQ
jgi:alpha-glucosidase